MIVDSSCSSMIRPGLLGELARKPVTAPTTAPVLFADQSPELREDIIFRDSYQKAVTTYSLFQTTVSRLKTYFAMDLTLMSESP